MSDETLTYWQNNQAAAYMMAQSFLDDGDYLSATNWQEYAAYCHKCYWTNYSKYY